MINQSSSAFSHILGDVSLVVYQIERLAGIPLRYSNSQLIPKQFLLRFVTKNPTHLDSQNGYPRLN